jgi:predicted metal-dependent phosphoesterase TrpH
MVVDQAFPATCTNPLARDVVSLRQVFATIHAESCPTQYNFHMHTICSDGQLQPEALIQQAIAIGLKGLAITDHHSVNGYRAAQRWLDECYRHVTPTDANPPHLWTGVEITSILLGTEVHILGYGFDLTHPALQRYLQYTSPRGEDAQAERVIGAIQESGGVAVLAHPVRYRRSPEDLIQAAAQVGIDGVEAYYAYDNPSPWRASPVQTQRVEQMSEAYQLLTTCGTDTHGRSLLQRL